MARKNTEKDNVKVEQKKKNKLPWVLFFITLLILISYFLVNNYNLFITEEKTIINDTLNVDTLNNDIDTLPINEKFINAIADTSKDSSVKVVYVSNPEDLNIPYTLDKNAGKNIKRVYSGRRINIIITGVDSRLGTSTKHADANHILSILPDSGLIEITSIPRDTRANAGMPDSSGQNKLTIVRALKGREAYINEAARIAGLDKIHYWVEVGFSQVIGILNLLGFKDPGSALQVLRSRTGLGGDDYQRCYNQGQFIRQTILSHFDKFTGMLGDIAIRGGLVFVETNLTADIINDLIAKLKSKNFPKSPEVITNKVRPAVGINFKVYDFTSQSTFNTLKSKIERYNKSKGLDTLKANIDVAKRLKNLILKAAQDSSKKPNNVISTLNVYFEQRAWHQINNETLRNSIRDEMGLLLINAYNKKKQFDKANNINKVINFEKEIFSKQLFNNH